MFTDNENPTLDMENEDFSFHLPVATALNNGDLFVLTGFHVLPETGGWMDQSWDVAQDLLTYLRGYTWAKHINNPKEASGGVSDLFNFDKPGATADIDDFVN